MVGTVIIRRDISRFQPGINSRPRISLTTSRVVPSARTAKPASVYCARHTLGVTFRARKSCAAENTAHRMASWVGDSRCIGRIVSVEHSERHVASLGEYPPSSSHPPPEMTVSLVGYGQSRLSWFHHLTAPQGRGGMYVSGNRLRQRTGTDSLRTGLASHSVDHTSPTSMCSATDWPVASGCSNACSRVSRWRLSYYSTYHGSGRW